jgi:hypothetical protein
MYRISAEHRDRAFKIGKRRFKVDDVRITMDKRIG